MSEMDWAADAACKADDDLLAYYRDTPGEDPCFSGSWRPSNHDARRGRPGPYLELMRKLCNTACPVREACLEYALRHDIREGIWGGMTPPERDELRRRLGMESRRRSVVREG